MKKVKNFIKGGLALCLAAIFFVTLAFTAMYVFYCFLGDVGSVIGLVLIASIYIYTIS